LRLKKLRIEDRDAIYSIVKCQVDQLREANFVHGDLRLANIEVQPIDSAPGCNCQVLDFDWAGEFGDVHYPLYVYSSREV
jgi:RIO-like serine/threonine protein kinase